MAGKQSSEVKRRTASTRKQLQQGNHPPERSGTHPGNLPIQRYRACKSVNIQNLWEMRSN